MPKKSPLAEPGAEVLNPRSAAILLCTTESGVRMRIHRGSLPYHKTGRRLYLLRTELLEFMRGNTAVSVKEARERVS